MPRTALRQKEREVYPSISQHSVITNKVSLRIGGASTRGQTSPLSRPALSWTKGKHAFKGGSSFAHEGSMAATIRRNCMLCRVGVVHQHLRRFRETRLWRRTFSTDLRRMTSHYAFNVVHVGAI